jgi:hypothetical protein
LQIQTQFLAVYLFDGRLVVHVGGGGNGGSGDPMTALLTTAQPYTDGLWHAVFLARTSGGGELQLRVDDREAVATAVEMAAPFEGGEWIAFFNIL